ncbi:MAG: amino acid adenylation domain-containing protein [Hormoscilla sp.]
MTFIDLLQYQAQNKPDQVIYIFLQNGETEKVSLTYQELNQRSREIAAQLQSFSAIGSRALLLYPPGLEFITAFFGCLYAGIVAVPAYPPRRNQKMSRVQAIVADSQATLALTTASELARLGNQFAQDPELASLHWLATDQLQSDQRLDWQEPALCSSTLAFLQYTSGSTGAPKGVMVSHGNLLHNERLIEIGFGHTTDTLVVGWLPLFHDMGLIGNVLQPLYMGIPSVLMSPAAFLQKPLRWLQAISRYKATTSGGPNFAYDLCVQKISPQQRADIDLSSWSVAFNGSEPVHAETLERFSHYFADCGFRREAFYPCYGMAEATLFVSGGVKTALPVLLQVEAADLEQNCVVATADPANARVIVGCGQSLFEKIALVDPESNTRCRADQVGEIWISSLSVAQGYWNQPEATAKTFNAYLDTGEGPFLRTGDLGFMQDGELFITGRLKDLIIIWGRNHYPQDIELTVERSHPALRPSCGAAFGVEVAGEERLVVAQEVKRNSLRQINVEAVVGAIRKAVSEEQDLQVYAVLLLKTGSIPKTSSGKIQRQTCWTSFLNGSLDVVGSNILENFYSGDIEQSLTYEVLLAIDSENRPQRLQSYLRELVARVLKVAPSQLDLQTTLSTLGLDSLMVIELKNDIETSLGVVLPMADLLEGPSISQLATEILNLLSAPIAASEIPLVPVQATGTEHFLSYGQRSLWFLHQMTPESTAYNIASAVRICSELDIPALQKAFQALVSRHPALRTTFTASQEGPVAQVHEQGSFCFQEENASNWSEAFLNERLVEESHCPFALERGPLLRVRLFTQGDQGHILLLIMHHIVVDFWSLAVLVKELSILYQAEKTGGTPALEPLALQYTDYAYWQSKRLASPEGERLWAYWHKQLAGELPVLNLPTDRPRPPVQTYRGASVPFKLSMELTQKLKALGRDHRATLYMTLLAAFQVLLHRYTGQEDILVGSPTAGRNRAELAGLVGYFVNPVILRADLSGNPSFEVFLDRVRSSVLEAFKHQDYPFALLVEGLQPVRDLSRSPLFQVMFILHKAHLLDEQGLTQLALGESGARLNLGELELESWALEQRVAQFDLTLRTAERDGGIAASFVYNTELFEAATIHRMVGHFQTLLDAIVVNPQQQVSTLPLLTSPERHQLLVEWNNPPVAYPQNRCIHQLFEAQVERIPEAVAVVFENQQWTYRELNARANQLAHHLQILGVGPEVLVGICMERSLEMVVGLLGILKAGGAYVPLDPAYPKERLAFMLSDSQVPVLLTQQKLVSELPEHWAKVVCLDADWEAIAWKPEGNPVSDVEPTNLAYTLYTSGSTGKPKGVAIQHQSTVALCHWARGVFTTEQLAGVLASTSICFDLSVFELFVPLSWGGKTILAENTLHLITLSAAQYVTLINTVPSAIAELLRINGIPTSACTVNLAGEPLQNRLVQQLYQKDTIGQVFNLYGPSEDTTYSTFALVEKGYRRHPTIGRPITNTQIYILDDYLQPVPIGVIGELHIGGAGLARGYLNRPELTQEKFISNPFIDKPGARLYKTGDLARYLPDGNIEFLGRIDHQVKIRGFRIELGEVEALLGQHPEVRDAIVIVREDRADDKRIVAYVVPSNPSRGLPPSELRPFLKKKLPDYMVPTAFVSLEVMPLTPNGKIDRRALPVPDRASQSELEGIFVAPRTPVEEEIARIWAEVLGIERVGIHDNFFKLGGYSLLVTQVLSRVREAFQVELPLREIFEAPTVAAQALVIEKSQAIQKGGNMTKIQAVSRGTKNFDQLLAKLEQLSDNEAKNILRGEKSE